MPRFRQSYWGATPPVGPFEINRASMQAMGLIGWWSPARQPGILYGVPDMAGNLPATMVGSVAYVYDPIMGWALDYVADSNKYLEPGTSQLLSPTGAMTVSVWFNADVITGDTKLVDRDTSASRGYSLAVNTSKITWGVPGYAIDKVGPDLVVGATYHLVATGDATAGWDLYLNGQLIGEMAWHTPGSSTAATRISRGSYTGYFGPFNGRIGDVRIYNRGMSPAEAWQLWDPLTRWELYKPLRRLWAAGAMGATPPVVTGRSFAVMIGG